MADDVPKAEPLYVTGDIACPQCGYNLRGLPMGQTVRCPECGMASDLARLRAELGGSLKQRARRLESYFAHSILWVLFCLPAATFAVLLWPGLPAGALGGSSITAFVIACGLCVLFVVMTVINLRAAVAVGRDAWEGIVLLGASVTFLLVATFGLGALLGGCIDFADAGRLAGLGWAVLGGMSLALALLLYRWFRRKMTQAVLRQIGVLGEAGHGADSP